MTVFLAGMRATADRLNDHTLEDSTTSGLVAATGYSVNSFSGRKVNGITTVYVSVSRTGATITANSAGNITDSLCATLPSGWRPPESVSGIFIRAGTASGGFTALSDGTCTLKTLSGTGEIPNGSGLEFNASWISEND